MKSITKSGIKVLMVLLGVLLIVVSVAGCGDKYPKDPVVFADLGWDSALVHNQIAAFILENGYEYPESEFTPGETIPLFAGLERGDIDVNMECWTENQQEAYDKAIAAGTIVDLGENFWDNWQGWLVPTYMVENGDLPADISVDTMPQYWELFKDPEDSSKGRFYSCIAGWECEKINADQLAAYGLDEYYNLVNPGSGDAMHASLYGAYQKGEPYITYEWGPEWITGKLDLTLLEEPVYDEAVWESTHGCAYPSQDLFITGHKTFPDKAPELVEMFGKWKMDTKTLGQALAYMQDTGGEPFDAAIWFIKEREDIWTTFVPADVAQKVKDAVAQGIVEPQGIAE